MKKILLQVILGLIAINFNLLRGAANDAAYDTSRIYNAMAKARAGDTVNIVMIGGSITQGTAATTEDHRYTNLVTAWWRTTFPDATINLINAGIGGTGSDVGTFRTESDVLKYNPDFVVIEFAVNDAERGPGGEYVQKMMEGIVRQLLKTKTAVMFNMLKMELGGTAQENHKIVGNYYKIPMISYADIIDSAVAADGITLRDIYGDNPGIHPNNTGMQYIADFIIEELTINYNHLPSDENLPEVDTVLPAPLITDTYAHTYKYTTSSLIPTENTGWDTEKVRWVGNAPGEEMVFDIDGNAIAVQYTRHNSTERGQIEIWVDDRAHQTLDAYWTETWGPATVFALIEEGLEDTIHKLHIKVLESSSTDGHTFYLLNVMKAGNFEKAAPVANAGGNFKILSGTMVPLDGSQSWDPDNADTVLTYQWSILSAPEENTVEIENATDVTASFTPVVEGSYIIGLTVNNGTYNSVMSKKTIQVREVNAKPVANAGENAYVATKKQIVIDGSGSYDDDDDLLLFTWELVSQPAQSNFTITAKTSQIKLTPRYDGEYVVTLVVNDSIENSDADTVIITAVTDYSGIEQTENASFSLFPNPVKDKLLIRPGKNFNEESEISIYTLNGKRVYFNSFFLIKENEIIVDVSGLKDGIYLLMIRNGENVETKKFSIKN